MSIIEQIFGVSPDGGTGVLELLLLIAPLVAAVALLQWRNNRASG
jgi:hypothetical protein